MATSDLLAWHELDKGLGDMVDHFGNLMKASRIPDEEGESATSREKRAPGDMLEIWAEKLVFSAHLCLHKTSQLKRAAVLSDFGALIENVRNIRGALDKENTIVAARLVSMRQEALAMLTELEVSYYASRHRGRLVSTATSEKLQELSRLA